MERGGHEVYWDPSVDYTFRINMSTLPALNNATRVVNRIKDGARMWNDMITYCPHSAFRSSIIFGRDKGPWELRAGTPTTTRAGGPTDHVNTVDFGKCCPSPDFHHCGEDPIACAELHWQGGNQFLVEDADIRFADNVSWSDSYAAPPSTMLDLWTIATHEFGHVIGLAHVSLSTNQVMAHITPPGTMRRHLRKSDVLGLCRIRLTCAGSG